MLYISFYFYLCISYISLYLKPIYVVVYTFNSLLLTALSSFYLSISLVIDICLFTFYSFTSSFSCPFPFSSFVLGPGQSTHGHHLAHCGSLDKGVTSQSPHISQDAFSRLDAHGDCEWKLCSINTLHTVKRELFSKAVGRHNSQPLLPWCCVTNSLSLSLIFGISTAERDIGIYIQLTCLGM